MPVDLQGMRRIVDTALDAGITFLDTAERYGGGESERFLGEALHGRRERVVLATKFGGGPPGGRPRGTATYVAEAIKASLSRLQTDYVDLLYYHAPDGVTPIAETLGALHELIERGDGKGGFSVRQCRRYESRHRRQESDQSARLAHQSCSTETTPGSSSQRRS